MTDRDVFQLKSSRALWRQRALVLHERNERLSRKLASYRDAYYKARRDAFDNGLNLHLAKVDT